MQKALVFGLVGLVSCLVSQAAGGEQHSGAVQSAGAPGRPGISAPAAMLKRLFKADEDHLATDGFWFVFRNKRVAYIWLDADGKEHVAHGFKIASVDGKFLDADGDMVEYKAGDILVETFPGRQYRAKPTHKETPKVTVSNLIVFSENEIPIELTPWEKSAIKRTNELRQTVGLPLLKVSPALIAVSRKKATNVAKAGSLNHAIEPNGYRENLYWNLRDATSVVDGWWNSRDETNHPGISHFKNIISNSQYIGVSQSDNAVGNPYSAMVFQ